MKILTLFAYICFLTVSNALNLGMYLILFCKHFLFNQVINLSKTDICAFQFEKNSEQIEQNL